MRVVRHGAGPPLLLINGFGAPLELWAPFVAEFADRELITFDLPGSGRTRTPVVPLRMGGLARAVEELLDRLALARVDVLGYSFGGLVAQELARRAPERVRRLILCATHAGVPSLPPALRALRSGWPRYRTRRLGTAHQLYAVSGWSSQLWLHRVRHPTLVLHGDADALVPLANARWLSHRLPAGRLHVVPGAGHLVLIDEPGRAAAAIEAFLLGFGESHKEP